MPHIPACSTHLGTVSVEAGVQQRVVELLATGVVQLFDVIPPVNTFTLISIYTSTARN